MTLLVNKREGFKEIIYGSAWVFVGITSGYLLEYISKILIARFYGPEDYGLIILLFTFSMMISGFAILGMNTGASRYIAYYLGQNKNQEIRSVVSLGIIISILSGFLFAILFYSLRKYILIYFIKKSIPESLLLVFALIIPILVVAEYLYSCLRGLKISKFAVLTKEIIRRIFTILGVAVSLLFGYNLNYIAFAYLLGITSYLVSALCCVIKFIPKSTFSYSNPNTFSVIKFFNFSFPLLLSFVFKRISGQLGIFFVGFYRDTIEVGYYSSALSFSQLISMPMTITLFMFVPVVSQLYSTNRKDEIENIFHKLTSWILLPGSFLLIIFLIFSRTIITSSFGIDFEPAHNALLILSIGYFYYNLCGLCGALLISFGDTKKYLIGDLITFITSLLLFPILVNKYGFMGAAYTVLIRMILLSCIWTMFCYKAYELFPIDKKIIFTIIVMAIGVIIVKIIIKSENIYFQFIYAMTLFLVLIHIMKISVKDDLYYLINIRSKAKK